MFNQFRLGLIKGSNAVNLANRISTDSNQFVKMFQRKQFLAKTQMMIMDLETQANTISNSSISFRFHMLKLMGAKIEKLIEEGKSLVEKKEKDDAHDDEVASILEYLNIMQDDNKKLTEIIDSFKKEIDRMHDKKDFKHKPGK